ncbi:hypothetical protein BIW11_01257 [Tropilaelaps mercedesae]|uniref:Uncharacterized protein n=1 Tax=Tropilaelaps mercedesae TaxID=418985 RepID=A0A1V9XGW8_9ACAR|nr:hypothetical protein BIW11_01257 [Tropilaelaps mercedesae]
MSPAWSCFAVLAMLVVYSRCTREQLDRHIATIRTTATSKEMRGTPVTAVGEAPPKVSETPDAVEIEGRTSYFSRVSPRRIENIDKFSDRDPPIESTTRNHQNP